MSITYGVHSEVGKLRRVLVHRPGAALAILEGRAGTQVAAGAEEMIAG